MSARCAIVVGRFYEDLAERLIAGAQAALADGGARAGRRVRRAGRLRAPDGRAAVRRRAGATTRSICLGAVIRGETDHYDYVCAEAARGIQDVQLRTGVPTAFGVLTVDSHAQALARSGGDTRDSGRHAADAVLALLAIRRAARPDRGVASVR